MYHEDMLLFTAKEETPVEVWPNTLKPCRKPGQHHRKSYWDVEGKVTELCSDCLFELEATGLTRREALLRFFPDPDGVDCRP